MKKLCRKYQIWKTKREARAARLSMHAIEERYGSCGNK